MPRGDDVLLQLYQNSAVVAALVGIRSCEWDPGLQQDVDEYLNEDEATVSGFNGTTSLDISFHPGSPQILELVDWQRRKNNPVNRDGAVDFEAVALRISAQFAIRFGTGASYRISVPNCTLTGGGLSVGSRTDKIGSSFKLTGGSWKRVQLGR